MDNSRMNEDGADDVKEWLREISSEALRTNRFSALRVFRRENPGEPIPPELEFAALYAQLLKEEEAPNSYEFELARDIDKLIAEDEASKGGGSFAEERIRTFEIIDQLKVDNPEMKLEDAAAKVLDELLGDDQETNPPPENDPVGNLVRSYHRFHANQVIEQIGDAISNGDAHKGEVHLCNYLRRVKSSKSHHSMPKK